ncbi:MAG: HD domain-containing protein [Bacilli bacterium]|nr:HD domain-containing protein [Bacilli bacterium]
MKKYEYFKKELNYIKNERIKNSCQAMIELLPDYFFLIPASSTGKYHPEFSLGDSGLVRHVKAAVKIAKDLLDNPCIGGKYTSDEKDLMLMTLILHDGLKSGLNHNKYTQFNHPTLIKNYIIENKDKLELTEDEIKFIGKAIEAHMGPWNKDYNGEEVLPVPKTKYENFVHMCDYLASRKYLNIKFNDNDDIIE